MKHMSRIFLFITACCIAFASFGQAKKNRPQTPQPPFNYYSDSVEYTNADGTVKLGATFTYPKGMGPFVTAVLITGSGQQDRDETIFEHRPFAVLADYLTKQGFAVLRVDDRGRGKSIGEVNTATSFDFADDVVTSLNYLLTRKEVNKSRIGVIGHSEGGFISPIVYSKWRKLAFIVSLAGTGVSGKEILLKQQTDPLKGLVSQAAFDAYYKLTDQTLALLHDQPTAPDSAILSQVKQIYTTWKSSQPDSILAPLHADRADANAYANQIRTELIPWLRYFIATEPADYWQQVKCPVLAINGEKDIQVDAIQNITAINNAVRKGGNTRVTVRIFPGLNHLFQSCTKCTVEEYGQLEETFSPVALRVISDWMTKTLK
jgi:pimeloyl-ACP methyl ester carboxylesterase